MRGVMYQGWRERVKRRMIGSRSRGTEPAYGNKVVKRIVVRAWADKMLRIESDEAAEARVWE